MHGEATAMAARRDMALYTPDYWHPLLGFELPRYPRNVPHYKQHFSCVYVICAGDRAVKIGISSNPGRRAAQLQTGQSDPINVFWAVRLLNDDAAELEKIVHRYLADTAGKAMGEWYYIAPQTAVEVIMSLIKKRDFAYALDTQYGLFREGAVTE